MSAANSGQLSAATGGARAHGAVVATVGAPAPALHPKGRVMTEPAAPHPYPYPYPDPTGPRPSANGTAPPMPSEVTNERRQRHSGGRLRTMMRRIARRP